MKRDRETIPIIMKHVPPGLIPCSRLDREALERIPIGKELEVAIRLNRSLPMHNLYWAAASRIVEATDAYPTSEHLHEATKLHLGYSTPLRRFDGAMIYVADSIAFATMSQAEFQVFCDRAFKLWAETFGIDPLEHKEESHAS